MAFSPCQFRRSTSRAAGGGGERGRRHARRDRQSIAHASFPQTYRNCATDTRLSGFDDWCQRARFALHQPSCHGVPVTTNSSESEGICYRRLGESRIQAVTGVNIMVLDGLNSVEQYQAALSQSVYPIRLELSGSSEQFRAGLAIRQIGALTLIKACANEAFHCRGQATLMSGEHGHFLLQLQETGGTAYTHEGRFALCPAQSLILMDARRPIVGEQFGSADALIVKVPIRMIKSILPRAEDYCSRPIDATVGSARILATMLDGLWTCSSTLSELDHHVLPRALAQLTEAVFYEQGSYEHDATVQKTLQFERLTRTVRANIHDDSLSAQSLSRMLNISRSTLYGVTRVAGTTVERMIIDARLAYVAGKLDGPHCTTSLTELAFAAGFRDLSHFSRRFKEKYGVTPAKYRLTRAVTH
jgi:AraC family transcriptional activator of tynA and feaB